jgi:hypothetical protein
MFSPEAPKLPVVEPGSPRERKVNDMRSKVFSVASETLASRQVSQAKQAQLSGAQTRRNSCAAPTAGSWLPVHDCAALVSLSHGPRLAGRLMSTYSHAQTPASSARNALRRGAMH